MNFRYTPLEFCIRKSTSRLTYNILTFPTHERYQYLLGLTGNNFFMIHGPHVKPWNYKFSELPNGHFDITGGLRGILDTIHFDFILSQNKFSQLQISKQIQSMTGLPIISLEHTQPHVLCDPAFIDYGMNNGGDVNVFITEFNRNAWGYNSSNSVVIEHAVDFVLFKPTGRKRKRKVLSVVNDWINRDQICGWSLYKEITGYPNTLFPIQIYGDTPGISEPRDDLYNVYPKYSVFLNTSIYSPIPMSLLEAMSCGCAVVSTATGDIPNVIENGINGFISNDAHELRNYCMMLLEDDDLARKVGANARNTIMNRFNINKFTNSWNELFRSVANER